MFSEGLAANEKLRRVAALQSFADLLDLKWFLFAQASYY
jgi:hypothetical protein